MQEPKIERQIPRLVVMLTNNDMTVENAEEIFEKCKDSKVKCWGFKEAPLPLERMKALFAKMKEYGKTTFLEVVAYTELEGLEGARMAKECGCDYLMGTKFSKSIAQYCRENRLKYMPFVGRIEGRPSVLMGSIEEIIDEAKEALANGAHGIDLLGYRYTGNPVELNKRLVASISAPVCIAGSIDSFMRIDEVKDAAPFSFTIGSAFFNKKFGNTFEEQIDTIYNYLMV